MNKHFSLLHAALFFLFFGITSCFFAQRKKEKVQIVRVTVVVAERVKAIKDSLTRLGVDSIIIYSKACNECLTAPAIASRRQEKRGEIYSIRAYALPAYIFWKKAGSFYVKRIDQFGEYKALPRWSSWQIPLYDFVENNKDLLAKENYIYTIKDSVKEYVSGNSMSTKYVAKNINVEYYHNPETVVVPPAKPFTNGASIEYYSSSFTFKKSISDDYFNPVAAEQVAKEMIRKFKKNHPQDSIVIGNDKSHYNLNRQMKIYTLKQMLDSELQEIEMRGLWEPR